MNVLEASGIAKSFGGVKALIRGEITCPVGTICGLLGANGSGKSTFSKILSGMLSPDTGDIRVDGKQVHFTNPLHAKRAGIVMVHQHLSLIPDFTVWENINLGHEPLTKAGFIDQKSSRKRAEEVIERLCPGLSLDQKIYSLLPAEQQLVEIAKAISQDPKLLILDEPTAALEQTQVARLFKLLNEYKQKGTAMIFISHRLWEVNEICDFAVVFRNGENVGTLDLRSEEKSEHRIVSLITGKESIVTEKRERRKQELPIESVFSASGISYRHLLQEINFSLYSGEILGIGGLQGQGQDELMLVLSGLLRATTGSFRMNGEELKMNHPADAIDKGIVLVPGDRQQEGLFTSHSIYMNIVSAKLSRPGHWWIPQEKFRSEAEQIVSQLSIKTEDINTPLQNLSGGNQQKVVLGKWLPLKPKVLLLSDPAKGVDIGAKKELYDTVRKLAAQGTSVILFASDNEELIAHCDRVLIMYEGKFMEEIINEDIDEHHLVAASLRAKLV